MLLSANEIFSEDQALTASAASTNVIPMNGAHPGDALKLSVRVTETFSGGTSVAVGLRTDSAAAMSSPVVLWQGPAIAVATLVAGYEFNLPDLPPTVEAYCDLYYTVVGTPTAGKVTAGFVLQSRQTNS